MQLSTDRILTTHVGSLPRPPDLLASLRPARARAFDPAAFEARLPRRGARHRAQTDRGRDRQRLRRRAEQDHLHLLRPPPALRHRRGGGVDIDAPPQTAAHRDIAEHPDFRSGCAPARGGTSWFAAAAVPYCIGPVTYEHRGPLELDLRTSPPRAPRRARRGVHERGLAGRADQIRPRPLLPQRRRLCRSARRCAAAGIRGDPPGRVHPADRRARPRLGPAQPVPAPVRRGVPEDRRTQHRRGQPRHRNIPPEAMRLHICWGNYEGPHTHDIPLATVFDASP